MKWLLALGLIGCVPAQRELEHPVIRAIGVDRAHVDVDALLAKPLDAGTAVKIALANNAQLAAALDDLGVAGGELATSLGLGPLVIDGQLRFGDHGHEYEVDAVQNIIGLVTAPRRRAAAHADLAAARASATAIAFEISARTEIAFHDLIAAQQLVELRRTAFDAADAAATIRERMRDAGNTTALALARDRAAREQARIDLARAETDLELRREPIDTLLGLSGERTKWTATGTLPDPAPPALDDLETAAVTASLDLAAARGKVEATANRAGAESVSTFLPELGVGISAIDRDGETEIGPALRLGIPLFDQRAGERVKANAAAARSEHELAGTAVALRARARAVRVAALAAFAETRHLHDVVLPLRQQIVDETLLHYNAMDADPFELIVARRDLADAGAQYLAALQHYTDAMTEATALRRGVMIRRQDDRQP